jgi:hypothetical protein
LFLIEPVIVLESAHPSVDPYGHLMPGNERGCAGMHADYMQRARSR